jgi:hypothetical protein
LGDLVPEDCSHWQLLSLLVEIISIILCPSPSKALLVYLQSLVADHHRLFKKIFPDRNLVPKHHFLIHYASCIAQAGPACRYWCMRYEAKHRQLKECATSFLNVCKTISQTHQKDQCILWNTDKTSLNTPEIDVSDGNTIAVDSLQYADELANKLHIDRYDEVFICSKVVVNGIEYRVQDVVITGMDSNDIHQFFLITTIVVYNSQVLLVGNDLVTTCFDNHFSAYVVRYLHEFEKPFRVLFLNELLDASPLNMIEGFGIKKLFVPLRHWVCRP